MKNYNYKGSTKENHREMISLGRSIGLQNIRKMSMGDKIAEMANNGNEKARAICSENPEFFSIIEQ